VPTFFITAGETVEEVPLNWLPSMRLHEHLLISVDIILNIPQAALVAEHPAGTTLAPNLTYLGM